MGNSDQLQEMCQLSRHYDSLLWTVTSLWAGAIGGLLVYCTGRFDPWLASLGMISLPSALFFAANFRRQRERLHTQMPPQVSELYVSRERVSQWFVFLVVFVFLVAAWTRLAIQERRTQWEWWLTAGIVDTSAVVLVWCYGRARRQGSTPAGARDTTRPVA